MEWISVKDRLPESIESRDGADVLCSNADDKWVSMGYMYRSGDWYDVRDDDCEIFPTHWMPLPEYPKEDVESVV